MTRRLRSVAQMSPKEIWFRGRERSQTLFEACAYRAGAGTWKRERLRSSLLPASPELVNARRALTGRDWQSAERSLLRHFTDRQARFPIDPLRRASIAASILDEFPTAALNAAHRGDQILEGRYDLLGYRDLPLGEPRKVDWHYDPVHKRRAPRRFWSRVPYLDRTLGDHKIIWELNRHQHWLALGRAAWLTGDTRYSDAFRVQLATWIATNPPLTGINWSSMLELGFRAISWLWALHFFVASEEENNHDAWVIDLLVGIESQLNHIARHLSRYFSPNTHLLGEGLALYVGGRILPELAASNRWARIGANILREQIKRQVNADGGHAELSTHYHRYAFDFYLFALNIAQVTGDPLAGELVDATSRLATFCRNMVSETGYLPTIGDDDGGQLFPICGRTPADVSDSLALAAALLDRSDLAISPPREETLWMLGGDRSRLRSPEKPQRQSSRLFPDTGYAVVRSTDAHAIIDIGRHGFLNGGHAHADALSLVMSLEGRPFLVDPGTSTYTMDRERRDLFRSTAMHNTMTVDGQPQSIAASPFHWSSVANATLRLWRCDHGFAVVEGEHDGYLPQVHRRTVLRDGAGVWLIVDHLLGTGDHQIDVRWHLDPAWKTDRRGDRSVSLQHSDGTAAHVATTGPALVSEEGGRFGWSAPVYGQCVPAITLTATERGRAPLSLVTAIAAGSRERTLSVEVVEAVVDGNDNHHRVGIWGRYGAGRFIAVFSTAHTRDIEQPRALQRVAVNGNEFHTDAQIAVLGLSEALRPDSLTLINATRAQWTGPSGFSVGPFTSAADLHLDRNAVSRLSNNDPNGLAAVRMESSICAE